MTEGACSRGVTEGACSRGVTEGACSRGVTEGACSQGVTEGACSRGVTEGACSRGVTEGGVSVREGQCGSRARGMAAPRDIILLGSGGPLCLSGDHSLALVVLDGGPQRHIEVDA